MLHAAARDAVVAASQIVSGQRKNFAAMLTPKAGPAAAATSRYRQTSAAAKPSRIETLPVAIASVTGGQRKPSP